MSIVFLRLGEIVLALSLISSLSRVVFTESESILAVDFTSLALVSKPVKPFTVGVRERFVFSGEACCF